MRRLSGLDTAALALESESAPLHMMAVLLLDTSTVPGGYRYDRLRDFLAARIHMVPPLLQQLARVPAEVHRPVWVEVSDLDWTYHLPRTIVTEPLDRERVERFAAELAGRTLDRDRPLWQLHVIEDATADRVVIMARVHHALMDGLGGMEFMSTLFELEANEPVVEAPHRLHAEPAPTSADLLRRALADLPALPAEAARLAGDAARLVAGFLQRESTAARPAARPFTAPRTSFNARLTSARTVSLSELSFREVRAVARASESTVNDVVLAIVSGAMRKYLSDRGMLPVRPLVAGVPAATDAPAASFGNALSFLLVRLATDVATPKERLAAVREEAHAAKRTAGELGMQSLARLLDVFTPLPIDATLGLYRSLLVGRVPPLWNVIVSNVPGPPLPLYVAGARLVGLYPLGPVYEGLGLNLTVLSRESSLDVGIVACLDLLTDVDALGALLAPELDALARAYGVEVTVD
jgi:diacylglycerol O-acyltransferase